jgi:hypothetical protein
MSEALRRTWREFATDWKVWLALAVCADRCRTHDLRPPRLKAINERHRYI